MKKYFSEDKFDPSSEKYDPRAKVAARPIYSESEEIRDLRDRNFFLERELARYQNAELEPVKAETVAEPVGEGVKAGKPAKTGELTIVTVPATEKAPSGGIISGGKVKAPSKSVAKRKDIQAKAAEFAAKNSADKKS